MCACGAEALQGSAGKTGSCFPAETVRADRRNLQYEIRIPLPHFAGQIRKTGTFSSDAACNLSLTDGGRSSK